MPEPTVFASGRIGGHPVGGRAGGRGEGRAGEGEAAATVKDTRADEMLVD